MANPNIKKDANGNYTIIGFEGNKFTQQQLDDNDLRQQAEVLNGPQGDELRRTISANPDASAGVISGLYKSGSLGSNQLVKTFSEIDKQTKADREKQALLKSQEESNAGFKKNLFGIPYTLWQTLKGTTRVGTTALFSPVEAVVNTLGNFVGIHQISELDIRVVFSCGTTIDFLGTTREKDDDIIHVFMPDHEMAKYTIDHGWQFSRTDKSPTLDSLDL